MRGGGKEGKCREEEQREGCMYEGGLVRRDGRCSEHGRKIGMV